MNPLVSVFCPTYNHEKYIAQCLEGFLLQKTTFDVEFFIQDDASTDSNQSIIKEFAENDHRIIPVFFKENQYSQGKNLNEFFFKHAKGKYLAWCEGDDYWTDPLKLQKQVNVFEENNDCVLCYHKVQMLYNGRMENLLNDSKTTETINFEEYILSPSITTCSVMLKNENLNIEWLNNPAYKVGDFPLFLYLLTKGTGYFIPENMAVYRKGVGWSKQDDLTKMTNILLSMEAFERDIILNDNQRKLLLESNIRNKFYLQCFDAHGKLKTELVSWVFPFLETKELKNFLSFKQSLQILFYKGLKKIGLKKN